MERKNYLNEELSKEEKLYLKKIVMSAKRKYIEKNYQYINGIVPLNEDILEVEDSIIENVIENCVREVKSAEEFEKTLSDPLLYKYMKALSMREREVLFYVFWQRKQEKEIAKLMNVSRRTIERIKSKALSKIAENMLNRRQKNV